MSCEKRRILCAEPHENTRKMISAILRNQGHEVVSGRTVKECIELARGERFDLYLLDDDAEGTHINFYRELRAEMPDTPILFLSAQTVAPDHAAETPAWFNRMDNILEIVETVNSILTVTRSSARRVNPHGLDAQ